MSVHQPSATAQFVSLNTFIHTLKFRLNKYTKIVVRTKRLFFLAKYIYIYISLDFY